MPAKFLMLLLAVLLDIPASIAFSSLDIHIGLHLVYGVTTGFVCATIGTYIDEAQRGRS